MNNRMRVLIVLAVCVAVITSMGYAFEKTEGKVVCPVTKKEIKDIGTAPKMEYKDKTYYFCCAGCVDKFKADPEKYIKAEQGENQEHMSHSMHMEHKAAVNKICPVMGNEIKDPEKAPKYEYDGKTYYFCCAGCVDKFKADPEKYIAKLNEKVKCPVSGEEIKMADAAGSSQYNGKTYYFCCDNCKEKFNANPEKYIKDGGS